MIPRRSQGGRYLKINRFAWGPPKTHFIWGSKLTFLKIDKFCSKIGCKSDDIWIILYQFYYQYCRGVLEKLKSTIGLFWGVYI